MSGKLTHVIIRTLDWLADRTTKPSESPLHQQIGRQGEEDAYFYLRRKGYTIVARNFRSHLRKGEIDLIAWQGSTLCFVEVKTRTTRAVKPAQAAVDRDKQHSLRQVAREYLRLMKEEPVSRFDIVTVYYEGVSARAEFELFQDAFSLS